MNHKGGLALIISTWQSWIQHRGFFFLLAFGWMMPLVVYLFVWQVAAAEGGLTGFTRGSLVSYYLILILVNQITYSQTNWTVGDNIRVGEINTWLLRPIPPIYNTLSAEVAGKVVYMLFAVPVVALLALILKPELHLSWQMALAFIPALAMAWALRFFWGYWLALLAFWATQADALLALQDTLIFLLAGQLAPYRLLPPALKVLARWLPFRYMVGFPVDVLTGQLSITEIWQGFVIQGCWLALAYALYRILWRNGTRRYAAIGG